LNGSWQKVIKPFNKVASSAQLFDAGRDSLGELLLAATGQRSRSQDEIIDVLAGPPQVTPDGRRMHQEMANEIRSVLDGQRLVSLDTVLSLGEGLNSMAGGKRANDGMLILAGELREFEMPQPIFSSGERTQSNCFAFHQCLKHRSIPNDPRTGASHRWPSPSSPCPRRSTRSKCEFRHREWLEQYFERQHT